VILRFWSFWFLDVMSQYYHNFICIYIVRLYQCIRLSYWLCRVINVLSKTESENSSNFHSSQRPFYVVYPRTLNIYKGGKGHSRRVCILAKYICGCTYFIGFHVYSLRIKHIAVKLITIQMSHYVKS
jgi:hypothetical protein